jgi:DNA modification methylase
LNYEAFISSKLHTAPPTGMQVSRDDIHPMLFDFQRDLVEWALSRGRAAVFADCGLGKTFIQLEWARFIGNVLIVAPLAVSKQTVREAEKIDIEINVCRTQDDVKPGINITNYEMIHHFKPDFDGIVLDESSILKSYSGKYRQQLTTFAETIPFRLACTATPAPNDLIEIINHAEYLGIMTGKEIIALYFTQDGNTTHKWRIKGHARDAFWRWMATWSVAMRYPSDLGYPDDGFILPELRITEHVVSAEGIDDGRMFPVEAQSLDERRIARKASVDDRVEMTQQIVESIPAEPWLVWCGLNDESAKASRACNAVEVKGSDSQSHKEDSMIGFSAGDVQRLVTKPSIAGFGMNWQHCSNVVFLGLSDSYEQFYQAVRRCWRFGQKKPVNVHIVISEEEGAVRANIERKEREAESLFTNIIEHMKGLQMDASHTNEMTYEEDTIEGEGYQLLLGDCIKRAKEIPDESIGLSVFSPPFPGMYVYTNSPSDMGNTKNIDEMIEHYRFLVPELYRITKPGRSCCVHLTQAVAFKWIDGYIGMKDFRGRVIEAMESEGWVYYGEVAIDKDPQVKAIRTKDQGLLFKTLAKDSSKLHMALADYLLQFRKPGDNEEPIRAGISDKYENPNGWITSEEWIEWAAPVWYRQTKHYPGGIRETDVLNVACARETDDERHLCPLQLGVIERAVKLWSNPGDTVFSPFMGIGSEGYGAVNLHRNFIGIELKRSYFETAVSNIEQAINDRDRDTLFAGMEA